MKKKLIKYIILTIIIILYLIIGYKYKLYLKCPFKLITGFYCPGCGVTRMLYKIITLDFYQAFRYNPLLFVCFPFILFLLINNIYSHIKNKKALYKKIPELVWYILIIIFIIYGILRNFIPFLAPTHI